MPQLTPIQAVRAKIRQIPKGKVSTYGAVAEAAGIPRGARLTVRALHGTHDLPWFRVVGAGGRIATAGESAYEQRFRLESEGVRFSGKRVLMKEFEHHFPRPRKTAKKVTPTRAAKRAPGRRAPRAGRG